MKFCGCTSVADAELAVACGADAIGVIVAARSPRRVDIASARAIAAAVPPLLDRIAVVVDPANDEVTALEALGFTLQFCGDERAAWCETATRGAYLKVYHVDSAADAADAAATFALHAADYTRATWLFDTAVAGMRGGTGQRFDWGIAPALAGERRFVMSGGLTPENVADCIRRTRPYGVDVRSGIETDGVKDVSKMRAFVRAVREADEQA